jgi:hypothetical protein
MTAVRESTPQRGGVCAAPARARARRKASLQRSTRPATLPPCRPATGGGLWMEQRRAGALRRAGQSRASLSPAVAGARERRGWVVPWGPGGPGRTGGLGANNPGRSRAEPGPSPRSIKPGAGGGGGFGAPAAGASGPHLLESTRRGYRGARRATCSGFKMTALGRLGEVPPIMRYYPKRRARTVAKAARIGPGPRVVMA